MNSVSSESLCGALAQHGDPEPASAQFVSSLFICCRQWSHGPGLVLVRLIPPVTGML